MHALHQAKRTCVTDETAGAGPSASPANTMSPACPVCQHRRLNLTIGLYVSAKHPGLR